MLVDNYPTDLSDIFDIDLFNPSDFSLDLDHFDSHLPSDPTSSSTVSSLSSPSPFLLSNEIHLAHPIGIDPQLFQTPSSATHLEDDNSDLVPTITIPPTTKQQPTAAAAAAPAHKSRKGAVISGGIVKKSIHSTKEKENSTLALISSGVAAAKKTAATKHSKNSSITTVSSSSSSPLGLTTIHEEQKRALSEMSDDENENDQELPQDWRPPPEVLAKMTSKEKRQLRNKISARNFRIRRKEYISTLEGDIAERDRLLDHFRTQLGSRESENLALRQEIAALKKALLEGRGIDPTILSSSEEGMLLEDGLGLGGSMNLHLPPPKMLPEQSPAEALMLASTSPGTTHANVTVPSMKSLLTANTQKDLPTTSRIGSSSSGAAFWGGVGGGVGGGGFTPVHTTLVPDMSMVLRRALMENINPELNQQQYPAQAAGQGQVNGRFGMGGFEGFADNNPFTLKTLDAYRMHLWGKMASQHQVHTHHPQQLYGQQRGPSPSSSRTASPSPPSSPHAGNGLYYLGAGGLADRLRPHFFSSSPSSSLGLGKHMGSSLGGSIGPGSLLTPPGSPQREKERENLQQQQQHVIIAAMASQTMLKKLGGAFWDAFVGSSTTSSSSASNMGVNNGSNSGANGRWDTEKVKRVLEGTAVLRVVDVDNLTVSSSPMTATTSTSTTTTRSVGGERVGERMCERKVCELLEESMRSLTIGKKG